MMIVIFTFVIYVNDKFHRLISAILQLPNIVSVLSLALHSLWAVFWFFENFWNFWVEKHPKKHMGRPYAQKFQKFQFY